MSYYNQYKGGPPPPQNPNYLPAYDNQAFMNDQHQPAYHPPPYSHPVQPVVQQPTPVLIQTRTAYDVRAIVCGVILLICAGLTLIMLLVFLIMFPESFMYITLPMQTLVSIITGLLLISAGRNAGNVACNYGCSIIFGVWNMIVALFHVVHIGAFFDDGANKYVKLAGTASLASVLAFSIVTAVASFCGLLISCFGACCSNQQRSTVVAGQSNVTIGYAGNSAVVVTAQR